MFDKMKQLMDMQKQAGQLKKELDAVTLEVTDVKGIKVTITGSQEIRAIDIDETFLVPTNKKRLETDLMRSLNAATKKVQQVAAQKMMAAMPGLK
ncbi:MAG: YbaB/EbfC family nucleoid-associated protein [Candidatus Omnitrophica bacterium]|jgi:DNA-binding YbaB/EbfC family protein|nr:YbaB/EbfC family nucleoid-associated protein [Candidatus Omnitrophota bacterium]